jgi:hypothetical protein
VRFFENSLGDIEIKQEGIEYIGTLLAAVPNELLRNVRCRTQEQRTQPRPGLQWIFGAANRGLLNVRRRAGSISNSPEPTR